MSQPAIEHAHSHSGASGGFVSNLFEVFTPRRQCMNFQPDIVWLHFISDLLIAFAYFSIPVALVYVARRRPEVRYNWMLLLFAFFIVLCGTTHLFNIWALWQPLYRLDGVVKLVTGVVSVATAVVLWRLIPTALTLPTAAELARKAEALERLAEDRHAALRASEATLRAFYDSAPVLMGVVELLPEGDILHVYDNRAACDFFGVAANGTQDRRASELGASPETIAAWSAHYREADVSGRPSRFEYGFDTPGGMQWLSVTVARLAEEPTGRKRFCYLAENATDRKAAADAVRESEARFRAAVEAVPGHLWTADSDGSIDFAGPWMPAYTGVPAESLYGAQWEKVIHPDDLPGVRERWGRSLATGEPYAAEFRIRGKDGGYRWFLTQAAAERDADGRVTKWFGYSADVHDLKQTEEALKSQARVTQTITNNATLALFIMDEHQHCTFMNPAAEKLTGYTLAEVQGRPLHDVVHHTRPDGSHYPLEECPIDRAFPENNQEQGEEVFVHKDGHFYPVAFTASPIRGEGEVFGTIIEVRDIAEEKRIEQVLREQEEKFRQLAEFIPQLAWMAKPDGHIFWYNRRWYEYTGTTFSDMEGWGWQSVHDAAVLPRVLEGWRHSIATSQPFEMTFPLRRADGEFRRFLTRVAPFRVGGEIALWFGTNTDIEDQLRGQDEREKLLARAEAAREEAEHANRMKDEFLATLSHELRTPLNAIVGWTRILRSDKVDDEDRAEGLEVIDRNAKAQAQLIEDLLDISRIISGKFTLDVQRANLIEVIEAALDAVAPAANAKGIRITKVLDSLAGPVSGDPTRLQQVVWNLLTNAVKFTPRGGKVQVLLERVNSHVEISVIDTGQGIPPEFLPHAFERFRQADGSSTRRHGGLGLGLSIVKQLVEMHGGSVRAKSPGEGQGSTFVVMLPITVVHPESPSRVRPKVAEARDEGDPCGDHHLTGLRVLVVDDEPDARNLMTRVLKDCGAEVEAAGSAGEALSLVESFRPDILVSDVGMPEQDGYDLMRQVRRLLSAKELPAAALTAFARPEDRMRAMRAGFQVHVTKPVNPEELVTVVATLAARTGGEE